MKILKIILSLILFVPMYVLWSMLIFHTMVIRKRCFKTGTKLNKSRIELFKQFFEMY